MSYNPIDNSYTEYGLINSSELFALLANNLNYLIDSMPIGSIVPVMYGMTGVPAPDPAIWQLCDGSAITNPASPLRGYSTPDYVTAGRYIKGYITVGEIGNFGGSNEMDAEHNHGGATGGDVGANGADTDNDKYTNIPGHTHTIAQALSVFINVEPARLLVNHYIKIT